MKRLTTETGAFICNGEHVCRADDECFCDSIEKALKKLSEYETLEEQGRLLIIPCKVGEEVWGISTQHDNYDERPYKIVSRTTFRLDMLGCVGKNIFLTKEAAEAALKEMEK